VIGKRDSAKAGASILPATVAGTSATGRKISVKGKGYLHGMMARAMMATGSIIRGYDCSLMMRTCNSDYVGTAAVYYKPTTAFYMTEYGLTTIWCVADEIVFVKCYCRFYRMAEGTADFQMARSIMVVINRVCGKGGGRSVSRK
jgi:hypothetical protein